MISDSMKTEIKTCVYFDLEATGLKSSGRPRVTEVSLIAVNVESVQEMFHRITKMKTEKKLPSDHLDQLQPRVLNKLTLCLYPGTMIHPGVTSLTGLDNYNLSGQSVFDGDTVRLLESFLTRLPGPVCLVAHNGDQYDYPLLLAEILKTGTSLNCDLLCVDSWIGIKEIFATREMKKTETEEAKAVEDLIKSGEFDEDFTNEDKQTANDMETKFKELENVFKKETIEVKENETTPSRPASGSSSTPAQKNKRPHSQTLVDGYFKSRKRLNFTPGSSRVKAQSFSLINLHHSLLGAAPPQSHGAEVDCLALIRVTAALGQDWTLWLQNNCRSLSEIQPMWTWRQQT